MRSLLLRTAGFTFAIALIAFVASSAPAPRASAVNTVLSLGSVTANEGASVTLDVIAQDVSFPGLGAWTIGVVYNSSVLSAVSCSDSIPQSVCNTPFSDNRVQVTGASAEGLLFDVGLASITFACDSAGTSDLLIIVEDFADATEGSPAPMSFKLQNGRITCTPAGEPQSELLGDVDCNGLVNSRDALLVLQFEAGLINSLPCQNLGDVNGDSQINSVDANLIKQIDAGLLSL